MGRVEKSYGTGCDESFGWGQEVRFSEPQDRFYSFSSVAIFLLFQFPKILMQSWLSLRTGNEKIAQWLTSLIFLGGISFHVPCWSLTLVTFLFGLCFVRKVRVLQMVWLLFFWSVPVPKPLLFHIHMVKPAMPAFHMVWLAFLGAKCWGCLTISSSVLAVCRFDSVNVLLIQTVSIREAELVNQKLL